MCLCLLAGTETLPPSSHPAHSCASGCTTPSPAVRPSSPPLCTPPLPACSPPASSARSRLPRCRCGRAAELAGVGWGGVCCTWPWNRAGAAVQARRVTPSAAHTPHVSHSTSHVCTPRAPSLCTPQEVCDRWSARLRGQRFDPDRISYIQAKALGCVRTPFFHLLLVPALLPACVFCPPCACTALPACMPSPSCCLCDNT